MSEMERPHPKESKVDSAEAKREQLRKQGIVPAGDNVEVFEAEGGKTDFKAVLEGYDPKDPEKAFIREETGQDSQGKKGFRIREVPTIELYALNKREGPSKRFVVQGWLRFFKSLGMEGKFPQEVLARKDHLTPEEARRMFQFDKIVPFVKAGVTSYEEGQKNAELERKRRAIFTGQAESKYREGFPR